MSSQYWVPIARLERPWGVRGHLRCSLVNSQSKINLKKVNLRLANTDDPIVATEIEQKSRSIQIDQVLKKGDQLLIKFVEVQSPEQAKTYVNKFLLMEREQFPKLKLGEYYWQDLIGLQVLGKKGECLGKVARLANYGAGDFMILDNQQTIAWRSEFILEVDLEKQIIIVDTELL